MSERLRYVLGGGRAALLLCEVQEGVLGESAPWPALVAAAGRKNLIGNVIRLAEEARRRGVPVVHCTADFLPGRFGANANARLFATARKRTAQDSPLFAAPMAGTFVEGDVLLPRYHGISPMTGTPLDALLRNEGIGTVIVAGVSVGFAITNLVMDAVNRSYQAVLPADAVAGFPEAYADEVVANTLAMLATVASTADILAAWSGVGQERNDHG